MKSLELAAISLWLLLPFLSLGFLVFMLWASLLTRTITLIYMAYCFLNNSHETGGRRSPFLRNLPHHKYIASYFPLSLHTTAIIPKSKKPYIFGYHPHGVMGLGAVLTFGSNALQIDQILEGVEICPATLDANFYVPVLKDMLLSQGFISASKKSLFAALGQGKSVMLAVGGAQEAIFAKPGVNHLVLKDRKGFVKIALQTGANLVPVFAFGENDIWDQVDNSEGRIVRAFQLGVKRWTKVSPVLFYGRFGPVPYRRPVKVVVGAPIEVPKVENPSLEVVSEYHVLYLKELEKLYQQHKQEFLPHRVSELVIA
ncbi:diacylglycerol O-acyltransferase 1 [Podochytrium sp. JEL0797]|nr:diacylglycerol O-acyltransferase 1 [Podochytrium sp. JEL0797]